MGSEVVAMTARRGMTRARRGAGVVVAPEKRRRAHDVEVTHLGYVLGPARRRGSAHPIGTGSARRGVVEVGRRLPRHPRLPRLAAAMARNDRRGGGDQQSAFSDQLRARSESPPGRWAGWPEVAPPPQIAAPRCRDGSQRQALGVASMARNDRRWSGLRSCGYDGRVKGDESPPGGGGGCRS